MQDLAYLTDMLPRGVNVSYEMVKRLNDSGLKPKRKDFYTDDIVKNVLSGKLQDMNVRRVLINWVLECYTADEVKSRLKGIRRELKELENELIRMMPSEAIA